MSSTNTNIHAFNTGRQYSREGQRIAYAVTHATPDPELQGYYWLTVAFIDVDRGIDGIVSIPASEFGVPPTTAQVLAEYDAGRYRSAYLSIELERALKQAARAVELDFHADRGTF